jgi:hypothetical protein
MQAGTKVGSLNDILASRSRITYRYRVNFDNIPLDNITRMKEWCEQNCKGIWRAETFFALYFQFDDDNDATMFMLRWGGANGNKLK